MIIALERKKNISEDTPERMKGKHTQDCKKQNKTNKKSAIHIGIQNI